MKVSSIKNLVLFSIIFFNCNKIEKDTPTSAMPSIPQRPIDLVATEVGESYIKLSWIDKSTNETGFKIERRTDQTSYVEIGTTDKDITEFIDSKLLSNIKYTYRVYSYNSLGYSATHSNEMSATTLVPINPVVITLDANLITYYSATISGNVTYEGVSPISKKGFVFAKTPNPTISNSNLTTNGTGIGSFTEKIVGLESNTKYYFRAYATNSVTTSYGIENTLTTLTRPESGIGSIGPGGGIVFYDKQSYGADQFIGKSWRYLEVSGIPTPASIGSVNVGFAWGCTPSSSGATYSGLGQGIRNQNAIEASCPSPFIQKSSVNFYTWAAWVDSVNQKGFSDWYIPSLFEVQTIYNRLITPGIMPMGGTLATSTEHDPANFKVITINGGPGPDNSFGWTPKFIGSAANQWLMVRAF